ncbi:MAG: glycosyltransferase family 2 protein [Burkholderiales bacterium]
MKLSVVVITKNEAANLQACLASVSFADELVVVDSGSTDGTLAIAQACGARVLQTADWPGFGPQKNRALDAAGGVWVLSIDADERVTPELAQEIVAIVSSVNMDGGPSAYEMPRLTRFCGQWIHHCGWTPDRVLRLFKRGQARFSDDLVHERVLLQGQGRRTGRLAGRLLHDSYPTPGHYWRKLEQYSQAWAMQRHASGMRTSMWRAATSALAAFVRSYFLRLGFLDGAMGFAVCSMQAQASFGKYFTLYCLNRHHDTQPL